MDPKVRRLAFCAGGVGGLLGALIGVVSRGTSYSDTIGAVLGVVAGFAAALYWSEHGGARRRSPGGPSTPSVCRTCAAGSSSSGATRAVVRDPAGRRKTLAPLLAATASRGAAGYGHAGGEPGVAQATVVSNGCTCRALEGHT